jgi:tetratricopeptide (TPR) repeat protein
MASRSTLDAQVRDVLRHLDTPERLQNNGLAARWIAAGVNIRDCVEQAILCLPEPLRIIIVRCDLGKQLHSIVAADLAVSERHFYRLRRVALQQLAAIVASTPTQLRTVMGEADPLGVRLAYATALQNAGYFDAAILTLEEIQSSCADVERRARIACRLANVSCAAGRLTAAKAFIENAQNIAISRRAAAAFADILDCEIEAAEVKLAWCRRDLKSARWKAERVLRNLRLLTDPALKERIAEAIVFVLLVLVDLRRDEGAFDEALAAAFQATSVLARCGDLGGSQRLRCMVAIANLRFFTSGGLSRTLDELTLAYHYAQSRGVPQIAASIAGNLCGAYGIRGETKQALQFGNEAVAIARLVCSGEELARTSLEVAMVHTILGDLGSARRLLHDARAQISGDDAYLRAIVDLYDADADLVEGNHKSALRGARAAASVLEHLQADRFLGSALRIEAEAHDGLGQLGAAVRSIRESVRILESSGHAYTLARAYRTSARISKKWAHRLAADDLLRALHA